MKFQMSNKTLSDDHATPERVFDFFKENYHLNLKKMYDPCPLYSKYDGLAIHWRKQNFINPPYNLLKEFVFKSYGEFCKGNECYLLFPLSKSDRPYMRLIANFTIIYIPFRIKFVGNDNPATQTHCLVCMK